MRAAHTGLLRLAVPLVLFAIAVNAVLIQTVVTDDSPMKNVVRVGCMVLLVFAMLVNNPRVPKWVMATLLMCTVLCALRGNTDQLSYVFVLLLVPAMLALDERKVMRWLVLGSAGSLLLIFAFLELHITHNVVLDLRNRQTFGTQGVPFFFNVVYGVFALLILYTRKYWRRGKLLVLIGSLAVATVLFIATNARGGYFSLLAFVALLVVVPWIAKVPPLRIVTAILPLLFLPFAFFLASQGGSYAANQLWSYRPYWYAIFLQSLHPDDYLFSTSVKYYDRVVTIVDNSWLHLLVGGGVALFVIFTVVFYRAMTNLFRAGRHAEIAFLIATCFYFNSESILLRIENLFVIYFWYLLVKYSAKTEEGPSLEPAPRDNGRRLRSRHDPDVRRDLNPVRPSRSPRHGWDDGPSWLPVVEGTTGPQQGLAPLRHRLRHGDVDAPLGRPGGAAAADSLDGDADP